MSDSQLLRAYLKERSEAAFALLVSRYLRFVYGICCREVGDQTLAEDVTQTVFLLLAQKATQLTNANSIRSWLFCTARFASQNAVKEMRRRRAREERVAAESADRTTSPETYLDGVLNDALASLSVQDREVLFLHYFDDRSLTDVGGMLGISTEAAKKRSARAVERLRRKFVTQGVMISAASLGIAILSAEKARALPARLAAKAIAAHASQGTSFGWVYNTVTRAALRTKITTVAVLTASVILLVAIALPFAKQFTQRTPTVAANITKSGSHKKPSHGSARSAMGGRSSRTPHTRAYAQASHSGHRVHQTARISSGQTAHNASVQPDTSGWAESPPPDNSSAPAPADATAGSPSTQSPPDSSGIPAAPPTPSTGDKLRMLSGLKREPGLDQLDNGGQGVVDANQQGADGN